MIRNSLTWKVVLISITIGKQTGTVNLFREIYTCQYLAYGFFSCIGPWRAVDPSLTVSHAWGLGSAVIREEGF